MPRWCHNFLVVRARLLSELTRFINHQETSCGLEVANRQLISCDTSMAVYEFDTPDPPLEWIARTAEQFPTLRLELKYCGEDLIGWVIWSQAKLVMDDLLKEIINPNIERDDWYD